jgi:hypothetical protein
MAMNPPSPQPTYSPTASARPSTPSATPTEARQFQLSQVSQHLSHHSHHGIRAATSENPKRNSGEPQRNWADPDNLPPGTLDYISAAIANLSQGRHFCEHGWGARVPVTGGLGGGVGVDELAEVVAVEPGGVGDE